MSSSTLAVGIVGLPNVGKSTLFNALLKKQQAYAANFPFATIEPNIGIVPVPDDRLLQLAEVEMKSEKMDSLPPQVPATVEFVDIAGLIAGAHKGEGLGNKFLSHIREVDAICHVVRAFSDQDIVREGSIDPKNDFTVIETELMMADLETLSKQKEPKGGGVTREDTIRWEVTTKFRDAIEKGIPTRTLQLSEEQSKAAKQLSLLSYKPILIALNCDEDDLQKATELEAKYAGELEVLPKQVIAISARTEEQLAGFSAEDAQSYLADLGVASSGLERLIRSGFSTLGLVTFLTAGVKEVRAWTIKKDISAQQASGAIHNDFVKKFIKADVVSLDEFINCEGWKNAREKGKVRNEGRDYIVQDGDVIEFKIGA